MTHRQRLTLAVLCAAQFLVVLDITVVNAALPSIRADLGLRAGHAHWAISAYAVAFGGVLLAAGRLADLRGRRRAFLWGVAIFGALSLVCGLAGSGEVLAAARALQGLGAALISPAALSILTHAFPEGRARTAAVGAWGSTGALAAASGVLVGGLVVELLDWRAIFLLNVPVAVAALAAGPALIPADGPVRRRPLDIPGAALATGGIALLVAGLSEAAAGGGGGRSAAALLTAAAAALVALVHRERRAAHPLLPPAALRSPVMVGASAAGFLHGAMMLASFLLLTLYMQDVLGLSPVLTGAGLLAVRGTAVVWAGLGARVVAAAGARPVMALGMAGMTAGLALLARAPAGGSYAPDLLPGLLILGAAIPLLFLTVNVTALEGARAEDAGLASGLLSTAQWVGGALGVAVASAMAGSSADPAALAGGVRAGLWACALLGVAGVAVALALTRAGRGYGTAEAASDSPGAPGSWRKAVARARSGVPKPSANPS